MGMVDIGKKAVVPRTAVAEGRIMLKESTIRKIEEKSIRKGDVLHAAELSSLNAVKKTPELLFHCHPIPIDSAEAELRIEKDHILARCTVKAQAKTGVEMEALQGVSSALLTVWDMVKYLEKADGQYQDTRITDIRVIKKTKGDDYGVSQHKRA